MSLRVDTDVEMTTRDGVVLRADVYRPDDDGIYPALLHRTPYDKANPALTSVLVADPVALARAGYAVVLQDVRGRFASQGELDFGEQEHEDGYDAVEWAAAQPWCDGKVGIYGSSYHAITAYAALAAAPPHLRAVVAMIGAADLSTTVRPGGLFELGFLTYYSLGQVVEQLRRAGRADLLGPVLDAFSRLGETVDIHPLTDVPVLADPDLAPWWHTWLDDPDGSFVTRSLARDQPLPDVPLLSVVGAMDFMQESMLTVFDRRPASERHRLVLGPWAHNGTYTGAVGSRSYPAAPGGVAAWQPVIQGWFDRWLKGTDEADRVVAPAARTLLDGDPVSYFVTGPRPAWRKATAWPTSGREQVWQLQPGGLLDSEPAREGAVGYEHDPHHPVPTCGGAFTAPMLGPDGVQDQCGREAHPDVVSWTSAPLTEPLTVAGAARLELSLSSSAASADVVVTLCDVEPDGFVANVAEGAVRTAPGVVTVSLQHTAHTFGEGHRIRVDLAGSSFPRFSVNPGTGEVPELSDFTGAVVTEQIVTDARLALPAG